MRREQTEAEAQPGLRGISSVAPPSHEEFQRELRAYSLLARLLVNLSGRRRKLDPHPRVVLEQRDLFIVFSRATLSDEQFAQLVEIVRFDQPSVEPFSELRLAIEEECAKNSVKPDM